MGATRGMEGRSRCVWWWGGDQRQRGNMEFLWRRQRSGQECSRWGWVDWQWGLEGCSRLEKVGEGAGGSAQGRGAAGGGGRGVVGRGLAGWGEGCRGAAGGGGSGGDLRKRGNMDFLGRRRRSGQGCSRGGWVGDGVAAAISGHRCRCLCCVCRRAECAAIADAAATAAAAAGRGASSDGRRRCGLRHGPQPTGKWHRCGCTFLCIQPFTQIWTKFGSQHCIHQSNSG